jgi:hypothetical protein
MAVFSALRGGSPSHPPAVRPAAGEVAMSLVLADGGAARHVLHPGDRVDLLSDSDALRLSDVLVLDVSAGAGSSALMSSSEPRGGTSLAVAVATADVAKATALASHLVYATPHDSP